MRKKVQSFIVASLFAVSLSACASTDTAQKTSETEMAKTETVTSSKMSSPEAMTDSKVMKEASKEKDQSSDKKKKKKKKSKGLTETFPVSLEDARKAVKRSMMFNDFDVKNQTNNYIDGSRSHTIGSGGEVIKVHFEVIDENTTKIRVRNKKTLFGWALQENWENEIMAGIQAQVTKMKSEGS